MKLFRKIRQRLIDTGDLKRYLLYAIGEVLIIAIGILFALQLNNWNSSRIEKQSERKSYSNIKRQVVDDLNELSEVIKFNIHFINQFEKANKYILTNNHDAIDTLAYIAMNLSQFSDFHSSGNIYETLVNSGDIKLLKNDSISGKLQKLEMTYNSINRMEDIHWELIINEVSPELKGVINYTTFQIIKPDKLYSVELQNIFFECINLMKIKDAVYKQATGEIETIIDVINKELDSND